MFSWRSRKHAVNPIQTNWYVCPTDGNTKEAFSEVLPPENFIPEAKCSDGVHALFLCTEQQVLMLEERRASKKFLFTIYKQENHPPRGVGEIRPTKI